MMEIRKLAQLNFNPTTHWGRNGYTTDKVLDVVIVESNDGFDFKFSVRNKNYTKIWETTNQDIVVLNETIAEGNSFGAYVDGVLIGWIIGEFREWNNSFYIDDILISEHHRGKKIGESLVEKARVRAKELNCRIIELETQNTNFPAISFYQKQGFRITGINLKLYSHADEFAIYMTAEL